MRFPPGILAFKSKRTIQPEVLYISLSCFLLDTEAFNEKTDVRSVIGHERLAREIFRSASKVQF